MTTTLTKRAASLAAAVLLGVGLVACSDDGEAEDGTSGWSMTNADGTEQELDAVPERLVMDSTSAATLIPMGVRPVGVFGGSALADDPLLEGLDLEGIEQVGATYGEIDVEKVAGLDPDGIVAGYYPADGRLAGIDPADTRTPELLGKVAPLLTLEQGGSATGVLERYEEFADSVGAEPTGEAEQGRDRFDDSLERFKDAVEVDPDLRVLPVSLAPDGLYVGVVDDFAELEDYRGWGLEIVGPASGEFFETVSWERADTYPADLMYVDARTGDGPDALGAAASVWNGLPAVAAGNTAVWNVDAYVSWDRYADYLDELTAALEKASR